MKYKIGFFADPYRSNSSKVHIVDKEENPLCGSKVLKYLYPNGSINEYNRFQWCANVVVLNTVNCQHCKKKWLKITSQQ